MREALRGRQLCLQSLGLLSWAGPKAQRGWEGKALPELWWGEAVRLMGSPSGVGAALISGGTMLRGCWHSRTGSSRAR